LLQLSGMNAVDPPRKIRPLSSESRIFRRGSLGDKISGRSREGRFLSQLERELTRSVGGAPSITQQLLIRRLARGTLRLELLDEKMTAGSWTDHDARTFGGLTNAVRLLSRELGLKAKATSEKLPGLADILAEHGHGAR
jgi:hypothetical protein